MLLLPLQAFAIDFVKVGNPANKPASNGKGAVAYVYEISKCEITNAEYCDFLNSVAAQDDKYGLFSPLMEEHFLGGISKTRVGEHYVYTVKSGYGKFPVVGVTWMSAVRYCNWLHYNALTARGGKNLTEGDAVHGAYDTRTVPVRRNKGARYWLPNEDEWLKAAYFDGVKWNEKFFAKGSNCYKENGWAYPFPHLKTVGANVKPSHYGTYDQQGNAAEWIENAKSGDGKWKLALGGSVIRPRSFAAFGEVEGDLPEKSISTFGIRVCRTVDKRVLLSKDDSDYTPAPAHKTKAAYKKDRQGDSYVLVGDACNLGDLVNRYLGRVNYNYYIARTELSNEAYCRFLNAVAKYGDPYGLYDENMETGACGGISRKVLNGVFSYICKAGWGDKPVVYVHYYDICRYANWMHYGCPTTGKSELGTTEGTAAQGAYDTEDFEAVRKGLKAPYEAFGKRNKGARFWIPSESEWYKAAYYDPTCVGNRKYHDYPTRTSDEPAQSHANYMVDNHLSVGDTFYVAPVDSFENAPSYYGTLQQGGNVWEWIEDWQYGVVGSRGLRGGSWSYTMFGLNACNTDPSSLNYSGYVFGARLCMAMDAAGWKPVDTPWMDALYERVMVMPKKHIVFAILLVGFVAVVGFMGAAVALALYVIRKSKKQAYVH